MKDKLLSLYNELLDPNVSVPQEFKEGIVVFIPKSSRSNSIEKLRPIILLNSDYKIAARILTQRMKRVMHLVTGPHQTSVGKDRTILQTLAGYRDILAIADVCKLRCAITTIDLDKAFDRVNHQFLFHTMQEMGFPSRFTDIIKNLLQGSTSRISINGQLGNSIQISSSVKQGCPMSMTLFAIAVEPLLATLIRRLRGLQIHGQHIVCHAYADDVGFVANNAVEVETALRTIREYEAASGAKVNCNKSGLMNIGLGIDWQHHDQLKEVESMKHLGIDFKKTIQHTIAANYKHILTQVRACVQSYNTRHLDELQKVQLANTYILSKVNYAAQILPMPAAIAKCALAAIGHIVSRGRILKVKYDTLTLPTRSGGLNLTDVLSKAKALYVCCTLKQWRKAPDSLISHLLNEIAPSNIVAPINVGHIPNGLYHLKSFLLE